MGNLVTKGKAIKEYEAEILYCLMVIQDYEMVKRACWLFVGE